MREGHFKGWSFIHETCGLGCSSELRQALILHGASFKCNGIGYVRKSLFRFFSCRNMDDDWMHSCKLSFSPISYKIFCLFSSSFLQKFSAFVFKCCFYFLQVEMFSVASYITYRLVSPLVIASVLIMHCLDPYQAHPHVCTKDSQVLLLLRLMDCGRGSIFQ